MSTSTLTQNRPEVIEECVRDLVDGIEGHPALQNPFYSTWMGRTLNAREVQVFAEQYLARTVNTSVMVALSVVYTDDLKARVECVKNLYSEYGNGDPAKAHLVLLDEFLSDLVGRVAGRSVTAQELHAATPLPSTARFSQVQRELFTSDDQRTVQGALLAQEHLAYSMLTRLYEGVRNYINLYDTLDDFHERCEYFYLHIGEAEKEHKAEALISTVAVCDTEQDLEVVTEAFRQFMSITADYWSGVADAMSQTA